MVVTETELEAFGFEDRDGGLRLHTEGGSHLYLWTNGMGRIKSVEVRVGDNGFVLNIEAPEAPNFDQLMGRLREIISLTRLCYFPKAVCKGPSVFERVLREDEL